jgi:hypothetical protein
MTMREKLVKIGAKVVSHARYVIFQMAEVLVSKSLFHEILERICGISQKNAEFSKKAVTNWPLAHHISSCSAPWQARIAGKADKKKACFFRISVLTCFYNAVGGPLIQSGGQQNEVANVNFQCWGGGFGLSGSVWSGVGC